MSIRPTYRKRSVVQVLADGMSAHPPTGRSCCEEAALTASELDAERRLRASEVEYWSGRAGKAEAELDEARSLAARNTVRWSEESAKVRELTAECGKLRRQCYAAIAERDDLRGRVEEVENERIELQAKLDAAENRPTLDREAVEKIVTDMKVSDTSIGGAVRKIMALAPAAEGWPQWLGPKVDPDSITVRRNEYGTYSVGASYRRCTGAGDARKTAREQIRSAAQWEAIARFIESEQAASADEDQRVEEVAERAAEALVETILNFFNVEDSSGAARATARAIVREARDAGWTPPESEGGNE